MMTHSSLGTAADLRSSPLTMSIELRRTTALAALALFVAIAVQTPAASFLYDAKDYWEGARALVTGGSVARVGRLDDVRGVLTPLLYAPAALFGGRPGLAVLLENAGLIAVLGAVLLPNLVRNWCPVTSRIVWTCSVLCWSVTSALAAYPMADLWAAAAFIGALGCARRSSCRGLLAVGLLLGISSNLRPAYLAASVVVAGILVIAHRLKGLWAIWGFGVGVLPQIVYNFTAGHGFSALAPTVTKLAPFQTSYALWVIRYDTVAVTAPGIPQQFFCAPAMARALEDPPDSLSGYVIAFFQHLPGSAVVIGEKIAAALHWPSSAPYFERTESVTSVLGLVVTGVSVVGLATLVRSTVRSRHLDGAAARWSVLALAGAGVLTLATTATETRFALPVVLVGIVGCAAASQFSPELVRRRAVLVASVLALAALTFAGGHRALSNPAAAGPVTVQTCAEQENT